MTARRRQSGYAIASVSLIGLMAMASAALLVTDGQVSERQAIEEQLVRIRANWAVMGHLTYVISRTRQDGVCDGTCGGGDNERRATVEAYLGEIYNANIGGFKSGGGTKQRRWGYAEIADNYAIDTAGTVSDAAGGVDDGSLTVQVRFANSNARTDFVNDVLGRFDDRDATLCVGLAAAGDPCPALLGNEEAGGIARIQDFRIVR